MTFEIRGIGYCIAMTSRHRAASFVAPRHLDRPRQWVQMPWIFLGMLFITALLITSQRLSADAAEDNTPWTESNQVHQK